MPQALSVLHDLIADDKVTASAKRALLFKFDEVLGLNLKNADKLAKPPAAIAKLAREREEFRSNKQFTKADALREKIEQLGYIVEDTPKGPFVWPRKT